MRRFLWVLGLWLVAVPASAQVAPPSPQVLSVQDSGTVCSAANTCAAWTMTGAPSVTFEVVGTCTSCVVTFEATANGVTWTSAEVLNLATGIVSTTTTVAGKFILMNTGLQGVRLRAGTLSSGGFNVWMVRGTAGSVGPVAVVSVTDGTNTGLVPACQSVAQTTVAISQTASTKVISAVAAKKNFICSIVLVAGAAEIVNVVEGTGSTCGTNTAALAGSTTVGNGLSFATNGGMAAVGGFIAAIPGSGTAVDTCLTQNGSSRVAGWLTYVQR